MSELHSTVVASVMIKHGPQTMETEQTAQTMQTVQLFCLFVFFLTVTYIWLRCIHLFLTFGNVRTDSDFRTPHDEILRDYFELTLTSNRRLKFFEHMEISPTRQDVLQMQFVDSDAGSEVRDVLRWRSKWLPRYSQNSSTNATVKKVLQARIELY